MWPLQGTRFAARVLLAATATLIAGVAQSTELREIRAPQESVDRLPTIKAPIPTPEDVGTAQGSLSQGEVELAPFGQFEEDVSFRDGGFLAVRFDPPFSPPFTIKSIRFPSFTTDGSPAIFPSIRLIEGPFSGAFLPIDAPLFKTAPYIGSSGGANEISLDYGVADSGKTFYVCFEFPSTDAPEFPGKFPFLRMDYTDLERGLFGDSYNVLPNRIAVNLLDRNIITSLVCELPDPADVPIESSSNLGANRRVSDLEFTFTRPRDLRMDGTSMAMNSLLRTLLLRRTSYGPWVVVDSAGPGETTISLPWLALVPRFLWSSQAMDKSRNRSALSSGPYTAPFACEDEYEPNGDVRESRPVSPSTQQRFAMSFPAGDEDFYSFFANPGDTFEALATPRLDGKNDLQLIIMLYDQSGRAIAVARKHADTRYTVLTYSVPFRSRTSRDNTPRQFTILIRDINGSILEPNSPPRVAWGDFECPEYYWSLRVLGPGEKLKGSVTTTGHEPTRPGLAAIQSGPRAFTLSYALPLGGGVARASIRIFDIQGRLVRTLLDRAEAAGKHTVNWNGLGDEGTRLPAGVYFARLETESGRSTAKVVLSR